MEGARERYERSPGGVKDLMRYLRYRISRWRLSRSVRGRHHPRWRGGIGTSGGVIKSGDQGIINEEGPVQHGRCGNIPKAKRLRNILGEAEGQR